MTTHDTWRDVVSGEVAGLRVAHRAVVTDGLTMACDCRSHTLLFGVGVAGWAGAASLWPVCECAALDARVPHERPYPLSSTRLRAQFGKP